MAKKSDPAVAGPVFEVEPYVDETWKPIEVTPHTPVEAAAPVTLPPPTGDGQPKSPGAGEKKEN